MQSDKLFTVIIPTIWKSNNIFDWIETLSKSKYVGEIVLIDNNVDGNSVEIYNPNVNHIKLEDNIYVNPAWNLGVSNSNYDNIAIVNDDIYIELEDLDFIFSNFKGNLVGLTDSNYNLTKTESPEYINISDIKRFYNPTHKGFGCFMLLKKEDYKPIPDDLKIAFGDNWLFKHASTVYSPSGIKVENRPKMSASVESNPEFYNLTMIDKGIWESKYSNNSTICLNMIVKDESHIIEQTLNMLINKVDLSYWVISDTGSSDNTIEIIQNFFNKHNIPGEILQNKWQDFAHNRNLAIEAARDKADYILIFDADDDINGNIELPSKLTGGAYLLKFSGGGSEYFRPLLLKSDLNWKWQGVLHECVSTEIPHERCYFEGDYYLTSGRSGNRSQDPEKYIKDAKVLEAAYYKELESGDPENLMTRYSFYCAQSYRDCEHREEAIYWYRNTVKSNAWIQEIYYSHLMAGRLLLELDRPDEAIAHWIKGQELNVNRAECYYEIAKYYRKINNMSMACSFGLLASMVKVDSNGLFFEYNIHNYLIDYELTLTAYYANEIEIGYQACQRILQNCESKHHIELTKSNIKYYQ